MPLPLLLPEPELVSEVLNLQEPMEPPAIPFSPAAHVPRLLSSSVFPLPVLQRCPAAVQAGLHQPPTKDPFRSGPVLPLPTESPLLEYPRNVHPLSARPTGNGQTAY